MIPQGVLSILVPLVKQFEGDKLNEYPDATGKMTIGYGHTGSDVSEGETETQDQADSQLALDLDRAYTQMLVSVPALTNESYTRQAALTDFVYNLGVGTFDRSTLRSAVMVGAWQNVKIQLSLWTHAGGKVLPGLVRRRQAEIALIDA
jgi:lysozyme